jgi:hypothetical protein
LFALQMNAGGADKNDVDHAHTNDLGDLRAGVVEHGQQQMVSLRRAAFPGLPQHRDHLLPREVAQHRPLEAFHWNPQVCGSLLAWLSQRAQSAMTSSVIGPWWPTA